MTFTSEHPEGKLNIRVVEGLKEQRPALVWELSFQSTGTGLPGDSHAIKNWAEDSHSLLENLFFEMISDDILAEFS